MDGRQLRRLGLPEDHRSNALVSKRGGDSILWRYCKSKAVEQKESLHDTLVQTFPEAAQTTCSSEELAFVAFVLLVPADVGGFMKDPEPELLVRWYQAAALQPFFRGHSSKCAKRREPWLFGEEVTAAIRAAVQQRWNPDAQFLKHK